MAILTTKFIEVCIFKFENDVPQYLLLHRSKNEKAYPNLWQYVTGTVEGAEKALDAGLREMLEETGLRPKALWVVPFVNTLYDSRHDSVNFSPLFAAQVEPGSQPVLSEEHYEAEWLTFEHALRRLVWHGQQEGLRVIHHSIVRGAEAMKYSRIL